MREKLIKMNNWLPEFDAIYDSSWAVINDEECTSVGESTNTAEPDTKDAGERNENYFIGKKQYETESIDKLTEDGSTMNKPFIDQNMLQEIYRRMGFKVGESHQAQKNTEEKTVQSKTCRSSSSDASTIHPETNEYGGAKCKIPANPSVEKLNYDHAYIVDENDIAFTFISENDDESQKEHTEAKCINEVPNKDHASEYLCQEETFRNIRKPANEPLTLTEDPQIKTLGDALKYFKLHSHLVLLEKSLEDVRKQTRTRAKHESDLKEFDKKLQKLSYKFHPDKVKGRGGSEEEMVIAQKLQTALNGTRTILNILSETFLEDITMDHRYGYYTRLNISALGNEDEIRNHVCEVVFKISFISEIKQKKIIAEIRQFLVEGKNCVKHFFDDKVNEFEKCRISAIFHLKKCIKGYNMLLAECKTVEEECMNENLVNISAVLRKMSSESLRNQRMLKDIKKIAKNSLDGTCNFYSIDEPFDDYFVLPFATYINIIIMCNVMLKNGNQHFWQNLRHTDPVYNHSTSYLCYLYYLASYFSGNKRYKDIVEKTLGPLHLQNEEIKKEFSRHLEQLNNYLEDKFKLCDYYTENNHGIVLRDEYRKYMTMMADFKTKEKELKNDIKKLDNRNQEFEDKYDKAMKESEEMNNLVKERLEQSRLLREKISASMPRR